MTKPGVVEFEEDEAEVVELDELVGVVALEGMVESVAPDESGSRSGWDTK